jgi:hypothetical protein
MLALASALALFVLAFPAAQAAATGEVVRPAGFHTRTCQTATATDSQSPAQYWVTPIETPGAHSWTFSFARLKSACSGYLPVARQSR